MKKVDTKDTPEVSGGMDPGDPCSFPPIVDPIPGTTGPSNPFDPWTDPVERQT